MCRQIYVVFCFWPAFVCAQKQASLDSAASLAYLIEAEKYFLIEEYTKATHALEQSLEADPKNSAAHFKYAQLHTLNESYTEALHHIQKAIDLRSYNKHYYLEAVKIALQAYLLEKAIFYYELLLRRIPSAYTYYWPLTKLYLQDGQVKAALQAYTKLETKAGYSKALGLRRYEIYLNEGQLSEAASEAKRLCTYFPEDDSLHTIYAERLAEAEGEEVAITYIEKVLSAEPTRSSLALTLSNYYLEVKRVERANDLLPTLFDNSDVPLEEKLSFLSAKLAPLPEGWPLLDRLCRQLLRKSPTSLLLRSRASALYQAIMQSKTALEHIRVAIQMGETTFSSFTRLISLELDLQEYDSAEVHARDALLFYPRQPLFYLFLGAAQHFQKQQSDALKTLQEGLALCFDSALKAQFQLQIATVYETTSKDEQAETAYKEALLLSTELPEGLQRYSYYLAVQKKQLSYALRLSTQLLDKYPDHPTYLDTHAWVLYAQGKYSASRDYLEAALQKTDNPSGQLLEHYGDVLYRLGDTKAALQQWKKAEGKAGTSALLSDKITDKRLYE